MTTNIEAARALYTRTLAEKFALGAFNMDNQETLIAIARAAANKKAPVLVEVSSDEGQMIGLQNVRGLVDNYQHEYGCWGATEHKTGLRKVLDPKVLNHLRF
jgi:fructose/tagatose bisphosphate aldolase